VERTFYEQRRVQLQHTAAVPHTKYKTTVRSTLFAAPQPVSGAAPTPLGQMRALHKYMLLDISAQHGICRKIYRHCFHALVLFIIRAVDYGASVSTD
jgi:hypothetical protein